MDPPKAAAHKNYDTSKDDGTFALSSLKVDNQHQVCVDIPVEGLLNPCIWELPSNRPSASLAAAQPASSSFTIALKQGGMLRLQIDDPNRLMNVVEGKEGTALVVYAVAADGTSFPQPAIKLTSPKGRNYNVLVPLDRAVKLRILNQSFDFRDSNGKVIGDRVIEISTKYNSNGKNDPIVLTVVGAH